MASVRLVVIKKNNKTLTYPTYRVFNCDNMSEVAELAAGGSLFNYGGTGKTMITSKIQVEQTLAQIKSLCNHCCDSSSAA